jgi:CheY-like chemotaxis protein
LSDNLEAPLQVTTLGGAKGSEVRPILLVNDSREDVNLFRSALRKMGYQNPFQAVQSGEEAFQYLRGDGPYANRKKHPLPHLLLLDPNMPGISGWEVLEWLRARPEFDPVVAIMFGGTGSLEEIDRAHRLGANGCQGKTTTTAECEELVNRIGLHWFTDGTRG